MSTFIGTMRIALFLTLSVLIGVGCTKEKEVTPPYIPPQTTWEVCHSFERIYCQESDVMNVVYAKESATNGWSVDEYRIMVALKDGQYWYDIGRPVTVQPPQPYPQNNNVHWRDYFKYYFSLDSVEICAEYPYNDSIYFGQYCDSLSERAYDEREIAPWNRQEWLYVKGELVWDTIY